MRIRALALFPVLMVLITPGCSFYTGAGRLGPRPSTVSTDLPRSYARVVIVADPLYRSVPGWKGRARNALAQVSKKWDSLFGITFQAIAVEGWNPPAWTLLTPIIGQYYALQAREWGDADLVIGVTFCSGVGYSGLTAIGGRYVVACSSPAGSLADVMDHEIAHTFGARHTWIPSAMLPILTPRPFHPRWFSERTKATIRETARRKLAAPAASLAASTPVNRGRGTAEAVVRATADRHPTSLGKDPWQSR